MDPNNTKYRFFYHYTNTQGLFGILNSQTVWATNYKHLNDYSELIHYRPTLANFVTQYIQTQLSERGSTSSLEECKNLLNTFIDNLYQKIGDEIYIASFCGEDEDPYIQRNGLLGQWRAYGLDGGYSIEFDAKKFEAQFYKEGARGYVAGILAEVIYEVDVLRKNIDFIKDSHTLIDFFLNSWIPQKDITITSDVFDAFLNSIGRFKNHAFKDENEVRLVFLNEIKSTRNYPYLKGKIIKDVKFRIKSNSIISYIELFEDRSIFGNLPITRIIVGPHPERNDRADFLAKMIKNRGLDISVTISEIPYISR